jgi:hypothetical protein
MSDEDDTTETTETADTTEHRDEAPARERSGVSIPGWLAGALVVLLGLAIGAAGFALGRATDDDDSVPEPIVAVRPGQSGPGELPGFPGGVFPGAPRERRLQREGGECRDDRGEQDEQSPEDEPSEDSMLPFGEGGLRG